MSRPSCLSTLLAALRIRKTGSAKDTNKKSGKYKSHSVDGSESVSYERKIVKKEIKVIENKRFWPSR
jgi:hypothetical protein